MNIFIFSFKLAFLSLASGLLAVLIMRRLRTSSYGSKADRVIYCVARKLLYIKYQHKLVTSLFPSFLLVEAMHEFRIHFSDPLAAFSSWMVLPLLHI